jgi:CDP-diacylglycerol--glycerol-3-phosphate 3-phosphatidyltransferase
MTISNDSRDRVKHAFEPIALAMGRAGLTPDALTLIGFAITVVGAVLLTQQLWLAGGLVVFLGGVFDMFDGTLARATGQVSRLGAFLDSVFDKAGEIVVYLGIIAGLQAAGIAEGPVLAAAAMGAAAMVTYTRARSESLGFTSGTGMAAIGLMPREVRLVILSLGLVLAGLGPVNLVPPTGSACIESCLQPGGIILLGALAIIAIGSILTTIQRILHVRSQARQQASSPPTETNA